MLAQCGATLGVAKQPYARRHARAPYVRAECGSFALKTGADAFAAATASSAALPHAPRRNYLDGDIVRVSMV